MIDSLVVEIFSKLYDGTVAITEQCRQVPSSHRFLIIPGKHGPRWIVPAEPAFGWPVLQQWRPWDITSRLKWLAISSAYRSGRLSLLPGVCEIGLVGCSSADWAQVGAPPGSASAPTIYIGTPSSTQKAVVTLVEQKSYQPHAVIKVPIGEYAARSISHEAQNLDRLAAEIPGIAPRLLFLDREKGVSTQQMIRGRWLTKGIEEDHLFLLSKLEMVDKKTTLREQAERLHQRLDQLLELRDGISSRLRDGLKQIDDDYPLPVTWVHGDFAPWNIMRVGTDKVMAFDWEFSEPAGVPGVDLVHYLCSSRVYLQKKTITVSWVNNSVMGHLKRLAIFRHAPDQTLHSVWQYYILWDQVKTQEAGMQSLCSPLR